ncbi:acyl-CoA thioesterase [Natronobacterium gregoryi]|uniref:Acyl-CoA hydrolase n=2 Tax=Natronobacterium gregoryi TaxID=44930 RepID=L0AML0_NATGS|nr:acyl-CoA thioesterase [Natronobacterium gregoryi]AFZ74305.1 acyl-CoA hydrolase [Natronobacterium gregoryi SP2]ELY63535.1 thioesterase [Natronobacterium gregoryi SP2]PLK22186.1 acyl-CoA thioesterase [Natronobacterium gregoryi SP2]SFI53378.1 Acyl-CoA hydrolase [Natronobacterium gregoryi]
MTNLSETVVENREMVQPQHGNMLEVAHGGNVMKWMDEVGAMSAMRFAGETCVTARVNRMNFERPIPVGDTAYITAYVYEAGTSSVKVRLVTEREDLRTREREKTTESYFVYVAIDEDNAPTPVPDLIVTTEQETQLQQEALEGENGDS